MSIKRETAVKKNVRPLIKWTGGKYDEFEEFSQFIPAYNNYYEPFFGGGGVFFALSPIGKSYLNDKSTDLIQFYNQVKNKTPFLQHQFFLYADAWDKATELSKVIIEELMPSFTQFIGHTIDKQALFIIISDCINAIKQIDYFPLFDESFIINKDNFLNFLSLSIADKFNRIKNIQHKENTTFLHDELCQHVETGVKSGLYLYLRSLSNHVVKKRLILPKEKVVANWFFVREFCYASMFRFNKNGEFNIPYGGIAYNKKNFRAKVNALFSVPVQEVLRKTTFTNLDFEDFLKKYSPTENDFIFLDPPYDSEFSEYDQNVFTKNDQIRLRDTILKCKGKCMVVIKETAFIKDLYSGTAFSMIDFDKVYTYNVRGRNNRGTKHLIILNYAVEVEPSKAKKALIKTLV